MMSFTPSRNDAQKLLDSYITAANLRAHSLAVASIMEHFAKKSGEDPDKWFIIGLVHDLDYEKYPDEHCKKTEEILREEDWPDDYIRAILSHGWKRVTDVKPEHYMEKVLFAADELSGLITATALVRPSKSIMDMNVKSVKKKFKDKSFSAAVDRELIEEGCTMLGLDLSEMIAESIEGMKKVAKEIGLEGNPQ
ncbi:HD domain-containing protein [Spirochaetia bacterium 38H-sp]|uniref:HD domain-containing protein n=1 Tax=Rarispira pelagica TaxID=3141764 RepID=A0ABU9U9P2_9SPIR